MMRSWRSAENGKRPMAPQRAFGFAWVLSCSCSIYTLLRRFHPWCLYAASVELPVATVTKVIQHAQAPKSRPGMPTTNG
eukprot:9280369-Alexandrium_andersonii.AAC.1